MGCWNPWLDSTDQTVVKLDSISDTYRFNIVRLQRKFSGELWLDEPSDKKWRKSSLMRKLSSSQGTFVNQKPIHLFKSVGNCLCSSLETPRKKIGEEKVGINYLIGRLCQSGPCHRQLQQIFEILTTLIQSCRSKWRLCYYSVDQNEDSNIILSISMRQSEEMNWI